MKIYTFLWLFLATLLIAQEPSVVDENSDTNYSQEQSGDIAELFNDVGSNTLELSYAKKPHKAYVGEVIELSLKLNPVNIASGDVEYALKSERGIRVFSDTPKRVVKSDGVVDTFYFLVESSSARLPDISASIDGKVVASIEGDFLEAKELSPPVDFVKILADKLEITSYKSTPYDASSNVVIFTAKAYRSNIANFHIPNGIKQGFESKSVGVQESTMTYYVVIPNTYQNLTFSYFNLAKQRYETINIPIIVDDDLVSTGISDLSPYDTRKTTLKITIAFIVAAILFVMFYLRRKTWYIYLSILPMFYIIYELLPNHNICIKENAPIYLLPIKNGTIFDMTVQKTTVESENVVGDFIKVHINDKVGWINKDDLCSN